MLTGLLVASILIFCDIIFTFDCVTQFIIDQELIPGYR